MTRGWRREGAGCGHVDVATVTAVSEGWELEGSRLEKRSEEDNIRRIQMRPRSLPVDPVSYPITTAARGRRERRARGCMVLGWGLYREYKKKKRSILVFAWTFERCCTCMCRGKHPRLSIYVYKGKVVAKIFLICSFKRTCVRWVKISVCDNFSVKCMWNVYGLEIQASIQICPCTECIMLKQVSFVCVHCTVIICMCWQGEEESEVFFYSIWFTYLFLNEIPEMSYYQSFGHLSWRHHFNKINKLTL